MGTCAHPPGRIWRSIFFSSALAAETIDVRGEIKIRIDVNVNMVRFDAVQNGIYLKQAWAINAARTPTRAYWNVLAGVRDMSVSLVKWIP